MLNRKLHGLSQVTPLCIMHINTISPSTQKQIKDPKHNKTTKYAIILKGGCITLKCMLYHDEKVLCSTKR